MHVRKLGYVWMGLAVVLYLIGAATAFAALYALTVPTTLAAVESAFGTFVILILILVGARKCWDRGKKLGSMASEQEGSGP